MDKVTNIPRMQEFKTRLVSLLREFNASISSNYEGDTHGIYDEWINLYVGNDYVRVSSELEPDELEASIGSEVQYIPPPKPVYVDPYSVFPVGTKVKYKVSHLNTLHPGLMWQKELTGIVVERSGSGLNPMNRHYLYILWSNNRRQGHKIGEVELAS